MASANGQSVTTCHWANCQNVYVMAPVPPSNGPVVTAKGSDGNGPGTPGDERVQVHVHVGPVVGFIPDDGEKKKKNQNQDGHAHAPQPPSGKKIKANHEKKDDTYYMPTSVRQALRFEAFYRRSAVASLSDRIRALQEQVNQLGSQYQVVEDGSEGLDFEDHEHQHAGHRWNPYVHGSHSRTHPIGQHIPEPIGSFTRIRPTSLSAEELQRMQLDPLPTKMEDDIEHQESESERSYEASVLASEDGEEFDEHEHQELHAGETGGTTTGAQKKTRPRCALKRSSATFFE